MVHQSGIRTKRYHYATQATSKMTNCITLKVNSISFSVKIVENKSLTNGKVEESPEPEDSFIASNRAKLAQKLASKSKKEPK